VVAGNFLRITFLESCAVPVAGIPFWRPKAVAAGCRIYRGHAGVSYRASKRRVTRSRADRAGQQPAAGAVVIRRRGPQSLQRSLGPRALKPR